MDNKRLNQLIVTIANSDGLEYLNACNEVLAEFDRLTEEKERLGQSVQRQSAKIKHEEYYWHDRYAEVMSQAEALERIRECIFDEEGVFATLSPSARYFWIQNYLDSTSTSSGQAQQKPKTLKAYVGKYYHSHLGTPSVKCEQCGAEFKCSPYAGEGILEWDLTSCNCKPKDEEGLREIFRHHGFTDDKWYFNEFFADILKEFKLR